MPELPPPPSAAPSPSVRAQAWATARWVGLSPQTRRRVVGGALAAVVIGGMAVLLVRPSVGPPPEVRLPEASAPSDAPAGREPLHVHGAGALLRPGLYRLPAGSRVADLIEAAGGPTADADVHQLNLAARVSDGDRVYVPRTGEAGEPAAEAAGPGGAAGAERGGKLDLNSATQGQLEELPGVGPATATAILDERKRRGRFKSIEELLEVRGIGPAKLEQIRGLVRV